MEDIAIDTRNGSPKNMDALTCILPGSICMGVSINGGNPQNALEFGTSQSNMDDNYRGTPMTQETSIWGWVNTYDYQFSLG